MKNADIYVVVIKGGKYADKKVLGLTLCEHLIKGLSGIDFDIVKDDAADFNVKYGYLAVLYDDMPLVTADVLADASRLMKSKNLKRLGIGRGFMCTREGIDEENAAITLNIAEFLSVTDTNTLKVVYNVLRERIINKNILSGAVILDDDVVIDDTAEIRAGAIIEGGSRILGNSVIAENAVIKCSRIEDSVVGKGATVGPFAYIRNNAVIGDGVRIGDFVEVKNSVLAAGVKAAHLCYVGDAEIGENTNVGCGTVFCNYDGRHKHKTLVGGNVFIGANVNLVAPVTVGNGAFIAAGTTVTKDLQDDVFCIGRVKQNEKPKRK